MSLQPSYLFICETHEGYIIKVLFELLQQCMQSVCLEIDKEEISICNIDTHGKLLVLLKLYYRNFTKYIFNHHEKIHIGVNVSHLYKMLKPIKKKDVVSLFIENTSTPLSLSTLGILVKHKENNRTTTSHIKITQTQNIKITIPTGYGDPIVTLSSELQKSFKELSSIGKNITLAVSNGKCISFKFINNGIFSKEIKFGSEDDTSSSSFESYESIFSSNQLSKLTKISGLSSMVQIYPEQNKPLLFKLNVGTLGFIEIYFKSNEQISNEKTVNESDENESE